MWTLITTINHLIASVKAIKSPKAPTATNHWNCLSCHSVWALSGSKRDREDDMLMSRMEIFFNADVSRVSQLLRHSDIKLYIQQNTAFWDRISVFHIYIWQHYKLNWSLDVSASLWLGVSTIYQCWKNTAVFQDISKRHPCLRNSVKNIALTHLCPTFGLVFSLDKLENQSYPKIAYPGRVHLKVVDNFLPHPLPP